MPPPPPVAHYVSSGRSPSPAALRSAGEDGSAPAHALIRHQGEHMPGSLAQDLNLHGVADLIAREQADEISGTRDGGVIERKDYVAAAKPRALGGTARFHARDHHRAFLRQRGRMPEPARQRELLGGNADEGAPHPAVTHQLAE